MEFSIVITSVLLFSPLWCLSFFDLQILITSLVSSSSFDHLQDDIEKGQEVLQKDMRYDDSICNLLFCSMEFSIVITSVMSRHTLKKMFISLGEIYQFFFRIVHMLLEVPSLDVYNIIFGCH
jgi:hypothetical protein